MNKTHWKKLQNPDYLGAYALDPGKDMILTIAKVQEERVTGADGKKEDCTVMHFQENVKPMILNVTNAKTIEKLYHTPYIEEWAGCKIQIYVAQVKAFGDTVDALRIRPFVPKMEKSDTVPPCADCGGKIDGFGKYDAKYIAERNQQKYGKPLCSACAQRRVEMEKQGQISDPLAEDAPQEQTGEEGAAE